MNSAKTTPPTDPTLAALEHKLLELAFDYRETRDPNLVEQYHAVYQCMVALGWQHDWLDREAELPRNLMPEHYWNKGKLIDAG